MQALADSLTEDAAPELQVGAREPARQVESTGLGAVRDAPRERDAG